MNTEFRNKILNRYVDSAEKENTQEKTMKPTGTLRQQNHTTTQDKRTHDNETSTQKNTNTTTKRIKRLTQNPPKNELNKIIIK